jgi:hypothetical protein
MTRQIVLFLLIICLTSCSNLSSRRDNGSELILAADREAPVGWVNFAAYADKTFNYSLSRSDKYLGTYKLNGDTLFLTCADTIIGIDTAIIRKGSVEFFGKRSPRFATISINKITK